uniref:Uncharacterized protein n=1 Tax=Zea mays TaxID=4577 RepID=C0HGR7_MAIZE|nr:unknown [Zea mays]
MLVKWSYRFNVTLIKTHSECHCCNNHSYFIRAKKLMYTIPILLKKSIVVPLLSSESNLLEIRDVFIKCVGPSYRIS